MKQVHRTRSRVRKLSKVGEKKRMGQTQERFDCFVRLKDKAKKASRIKNISKATHPQPGGRSRINYLLYFNLFLFT